MLGFKHKLTGEWLNNDFQWPHFPTIEALIAACYPSQEAFEVLHGSPENWEKRDISDEEIQQIFSGGGE
jgi:hypothetical protein